ncbi:hypothetical protein ACFWNN_22365 [Lentzea sp. NPDC058450]|uniref:hypothetical protein n=1 Tax=Lentzea sp. NPDC058450 TaxID=3346505 RepID=UPI0036500B75
MSANESTGRVAMPEVYAAVAARRTQFDNMLWQVPVLTVTAQAFLFSIALGADTRSTARIIACVLSMLITFLTLHLFTRHRQAEITDSHWLRDYEREHYGDSLAHGSVWRQRRERTRDAFGVFAVFERMPGFKTWSVGLSLFGAAALVILVLTIFWPQLLQKP